MLMIRSESRPRRQRLFQDAQELFGGDGLGEVVLVAGVERSLAVAVLSEGAHRDGGSKVVARALATIFFFQRADSAKHLVAVEVGQRDVTEDDVRPLALELADAFLARRR